MSKFELFITALKLSLSAFMMFLAFQCIQLGAGALVDGLWEQYGLIIVCLFAGGLALFVYSMYKALKALKPERNQ